MVFHFSINKILFICNWLSKREWRRRWKQKQQVDKQMWMCTWIPDLWIAKEHTVPSTLKINSSENTAREALLWLGHVRSQDNVLTKGCTGVQLTIPPPAQSTSRRSKLGNLQIFRRLVLPSLWNRPKQFPCLKLILPLRLTAKTPPNRNTMVMEPGKQRVPTMPDWNDELKQFGHL